MLPAGKSPLICTSKMNCLGNLFGQFLRSRTISQANEEDLEEETESKEDSDEETAAKEEDSDEETTKA